jgi:hypothetical protein
MRIITKKRFCLWLIAGLAFWSAIGDTAKCQSRQPAKPREANTSEIGLMVARRTTGDDETFNPAVRLTEDSLLEIQPTAEFSRGLVEALIERLQASSAFAVYEPDEESNEIPDGVDYVVKVRVISIGLAAKHGDSKADKFCRFMKCPKSLRDAVSRIRLRGEQVTFAVKISLSAAAADTKRVVFAESFAGNVTVRANSLSDTEDDFGVSALKSPAASNAAHQALDQAVAALARRLTAE